MYDIGIVGAGAAGLWAALQLSQNKFDVVICEKSNKTAKKIRISGGGRCNFTNLYIDSENYLSSNPHFCKSALSSYTQWDFISYLESSGLSWSEKHQGQLFCEQKANAVADLLTNNCLDNGVDIKLNNEVKSINKIASGYEIICDNSTIQCKKLIIASGGPSIPKMGSTWFATDIAKKLGIKTVEFTPGLVPLTLSTEDKFSNCAGVSFLAKISTANQSFTDDVLITHKGLSGPAILQISNYWQPNTPVFINFLPKHDLNQLVAKHSDKNLKQILKKLLPRRLVEHLSVEFSDKKLAEVSKLDINVMLSVINNYKLTPSGTEGFRVAEVAKGGVCVSQISSKNFSCLKDKDLYFIGESLDVTGHLGGFNFQWAWSSGYSVATGIIKDLS